MSYLSIGFVFFTLFTFILYNLFPKKIRWYVLLFASILFYSLYDTRYLFFMLFVSLSTYCTARFLGNCKRKKLLLILCIGANVTLWFLLKCLPWLASTFNSIFQVTAPAETPVLFHIVPIGISYYLLQAVGYVIDVYRGQTAPEHHYGKYTLFLSYFPTIVQGPISKYNQLKTSLCAGQRISFDEFRSSLVLIAIGIIKKMVVADRLNIFVNYCFTEYRDLYGIVLYVGALCYTIQLYMDFSGCVDICRGVSRLFGIELMDNFNAPYFSKSIKEFWRRWHISLSTWLKDYVYISLGGSRAGVLRKYLNLTITFLVSGIWHGAGFQFLAWGLAHALYQIIGEITAPIRKFINKLLGIEENSIYHNIYKVVITFHLVLFAWILFRSTDLSAGIEYISHMFSDFQPWALSDGTISDNGISFRQGTVIIFNILFISILDYIKKKKESCVSYDIIKIHFFLRWGIYFLMVFDILFFGVYGSGYDLSGFLYGGF